MGKTFSTGLLTNGLWQDSSNNIGIGAAANASFKLQVTGTTNLTGALSGTSATFSGAVNSDGRFGATTNQISPSDGSAYFYKSSAGAVVSGFQFIAETGSAGSRGTRLTIDNTGAATFSNSITTGGNIEVANTTAKLRLNSTTGGGNSALEWYVNTNYIGDITASSGSGGMVFNMGPSVGWGGYIDWKTDTTLKMRLTNGGNLGIGSMTITDKLTVEGGVKSYGASSGLFMSNRDSLGQTFGFYSATNMYVYTTAVGVVGNFNMSSGAYTATSDMNKKKDFEESTIGLNAILGLKPTLYRMKTEDDSVEKQLGFIAQEVKNYVPQAYNESIDGDNIFIGLTEMPIIAASVKAIQELKLEKDAEIKELRNQIEELKALINK